MEAGMGDAAGLTAVILAGGKATRLRPLSDARPKGLVPVVNRPFLEHVVDYFASYGIARVLFALGHHADAVQRHFSDNPVAGVPLHFSVEDEPLGTAGAVKPMESLLTDTFLVYNGDIYTSVPLDELVALHRSAGASATLALTPVDDPAQYGVVETDPDGRVRRFIEKPKPGTTTANAINAGIYVLEPETLALMGPGFTMFETDVFPALIASGAGVYARSFHSYWIDIGTPQKYLRLNLDMAAGRTGNGRHAEGVVSGEGVVTAAAAQVLSPCVLGRGTEVMSGATVERSVLWENCTVGRGARVRGSVVADEVVIGADSTVVDCVLGTGLRIPAESTLEHCTIPQAQA
jgi:mannose-1-phosphate guanylyltransferase